MTWYVLIHDHVQGLHQRLRQKRQLVFREGQTFTEHECHLIKVQTVEQECDITTKTKHGF